MSYSTITILESISSKTITITLNRPSKLNSITFDMISEIDSVFKSINKRVLEDEDFDYRFVVLCGSNNNFSSGLDLTETDLFNKNQIDVSRKGIRLTSKISHLQNCLKSIESCLLPVICLINGYCLGGALSIIGYCDIRLCTKSTVFSIKEVDIGIVADLGALQIMNKQTGNESLLKELALTGRRFNSDEALQFGLVSRVFDNSEEMNKYCNYLIENMMNKSPVALTWIKNMINYSRDHSVDDSLKYVQTLNSNILQGEDVILSVSSLISKKKAQFPKF